MWEALVRHMFSRKWKIKKKNSRVSPNNDILRGQVVQGIPEHPLYSKVKHKLLHLGISTASRKKNDIYIVCLFRFWG